MNPALARVLFAPLPKVPSATPIYKTTLTTIVDETTTTFAGVDIGVPHPKRIVIAAAFLGVNAAYTNAMLTVNGIASFSGVALNGSLVAACQVPVGTVADIAVTAAGSPRKGISVYVAYPNTHVPLDSKTGFNTIGSGAVHALNTKVQAGGFLIYAGGGPNTMVSVTTSWSEADAVIEDADATIEAAGLYTMGRILVTRSSDENDLSMLPAVDANKRIVAASWGPPAPGN